MRHLSKAGLLLVLMSFTLILAGCTDPSLGVSISGVEDAKVYSGEVIPVVSVEDPAVEVTMVLNGDPYFGDPISKDGIYNLVVTATDGEQTVTRDLNFRIKTGMKNYQLIDQFDAFEGFTTENDASISHNANPDYVMAGKYSLRVDKTGSDARSMVRLRDYHPNFVSNLSKYNRLGFWVYFPDVNLLRPDAALIVNFWTPSGQKSINYPIDNLKNGWNYVEINLLDNPELDLRTINLIEFQVRTADGSTAMTYYYDEIAIWYQE